ncbi:hypothetical protein EMPS_03937 [Entomortierella parvispora]|uniref:Ndc10 domain-containing protein n=1 Tax=Entomortierella parvispora TaxID=205924 RepID=A0A9P3LV25_9FUNG|nr:hypothetical protein EMPS_03937 [Entomortierella parvispora]
MTSEDRAKFMKEYLAAREKFTRDVRTALTGRTQQLATAAVMRACEVFSARLTHAGRHAGTKEAFKLGLPIQDIQHLGRWVMSQMMSFYAPKNPIKGAYYMAHFNGTDEPYILARDLAVPPAELQRLVFPWLEDAFNGCSDDVVKDWHKTCELEMTDYDPEEIGESDLFHEAKDEIPGAQSGLEQSAHTDKKAFLKLLVRMRRVILQDAVQFMVPYSNGMDLSNHLIKGLPEIFASQLFLDYSKLLHQIMDAHRENSEIITAGVPVDGLAMVDAINRSAQQLYVRLSAMQAAHRQELAEKDRQLAEKDKQHQQALADQNSYFERILAGMQQFSRHAFPYQHLQPIPLPQHRPLPHQHEHCKQIDLVQQSNQTDRAAPSLTAKPQGVNYNHYHHCHHCHHHHHNL